MRRIFLIRMSLIIFLLFLIFSIHASETIGDIDVVDSRDFKEFDFGSFLFLEQDEISSNSIYLSEKFKDLPFMNNISNGGIGTKTSYFVRGAESRHVLLSLDGMKLNDPSTVDRQFDDSFLSSSFLSEITFFRGPKSTLYGSDAVGGLIDLKTSKGENAPDFNLKLSGGSFGTAQIDMKRDWETKNSRGSIGSNWTRSDGISKLNKKRFNATERDEIQNLQFYSSSNHSLRDFIQTDLIISFSENKQDIDSFSSDNSFDESQLNHILLQQKTNVRRSKQSSLDFRNGFSRYDREVKTQNEGENNFQGLLNQNEILWNGHIESIRILAGVLHENEVMKIENLDKRLDNFSLFNQLKLNLESLEFQIGARVDHHQIFGDLTSGTAGISKRFTNQRLKFQYARGIKAPTLYQLFGPDIMGFSVGNEDLTAEKLDSFELTVEGEKFDISMFQKEFKNLITYSQLGYINQGDFKANGIEILGKFSNDSMKLSPFLSYTDYSTNNTPILRRPNLSYGSEWIYFFQEKLEASLKFKAFSSRKDLDTAGEIVKLTSYETFDFSLNYFHENRIYNMKLINLLDREYEEIYGYSVMPRSFMFSVILTL